MHMLYKLYKHSFVNLPSIEASGYWHSPSSLEDTHVRPKRLLQPLYLPPMAPQMPWFCCPNSNMLIFFGACPSRSTTPRTSSSIECMHWARVGRRHLWGWFTTPPTYVDLRLSRTCHCGFGANQCLWNEKSVPWAWHIWSALSHLMLFITLLIFHLSQDLTTPC